MSHLTPNDLQDQHTRDLTEIESLREQLAAANDEIARLTVPVQRDDEGQS